MCCLRMLRRYFCFFFFQMQIWIYQYRIQFKNQQILMLGSILLSGSIKIISCFVFKIFLIQYVKFFDLVRYVLYVYCCFVFVSQFVLNVDNCMEFCEFRRWRFYWKRFLVRVFIYLWYLSWMERENWCFIWLFLFQLLLFYDVRIWKLYLFFGIVKLRCYQYEELIVEVVLVF